MALLPRRRLSRLRDRRQPSLTDAGPQAVERRLQNRLEVADISRDLGDGDDHVEDLFQSEIVPDLVCIPRRREEWFARRKHARAPGTEHRDRVRHPHPGVTSAIIGPRIRAHLDSYLAADGVQLSDDLLDRIDEIVPPAATLNITDVRHTSAVSLPSAEPPA